LPGSSRGLGDLTSYKNGGGISKTEFELGGKSQGLHSRKNGGIFHRKKRKKQHAEKSGPPERKRQGKRGERPKDGGGEQLRKSHHMSVRNGGDSRGPDKRKQKGTLRRAKKKSSRVKRTIRGERRGGENPGEGPRPGPASSQLKKFLVHI